MSSPTSRGLALADHQGGVVTRSQLYTLGLTPRTLSRRVGDGLWLPHGRDVLVLRGTPDDLATRSRVAGLRHPGSVLTGPSAAALTGDGPWRGIDLGDHPWLVGRRNQTPAARVLSHPGIASVGDGPWRIAVANDAIIDMLRFLPVDDARNLGFTAVQTRAIRLRDLAIAAERLNGLAGMQQLAEVHRDLADGAHSYGERELLVLLRQAGLRGWEANARVSLPGGYVVVDVAFRHWRLAIEVDGRAFHTDRRSFQRDRTRQNRLTNAGWTVLRYTWEDVTRRPERVVAEIEAACSRAASH